jgi:farnesyl-diphosphate farnesyltransferase
MNLCGDALEILKATSRTFYIPISRLPSGLLEAVTSAYLCMRAIDEIEDHPDLDGITKARMLQMLSQTLQAAVSTDSVRRLPLKWGSQCNLLPEVSLRVLEWAALAPDTIAPRIWDATAAMADRMAFWAVRGWEVSTEAELDCYTFSVAGAVGLLLSDLWAWYDDTQTNREQAIGFGRGLQAVNILRNRKEDLARGVDFFPDGWTEEQVHQYTRRNLVLADAYTRSLPAGPVLDFCELPLKLAYATLDALAHGQEKLSRSAVMAVVEQVTYRQIPISY